MVLSMGKEDSGFDSEDESFETQRHEPISGRKLLPGQRAGRFTLVEPLGHGGMGQVWKAVDPNRAGEDSIGHVVLKFLPDALRFNVDATEEFKVAYRRVQQLHHEHICPLYDLGEEPGMGCFQVMQFLDGITVRRLIRQEDPNRKGLPLKRVLQLLVPVSRALDYAHGRKLIHRDVKPENIIFDPASEEVHLIDFGLAAQVRTSLSRYSQHRMSASGTEPYMAPEQWQGQLQDATSDQWGLAVVAWELLTGSLPFHGDGMQLGFAVCNAALPSLTGTLKRLNATFAKAMHKHRKQRFHSTIEFCKSLNQTAWQKTKLANDSTNDSVQPIEDGIDGMPASSAKSETVDDDLATLLKRTQESVAREHEQAKQLLDAHRYADAVRTLERIPEHLRDQQLLASASRNRDRVAELEASIRSAVKDVRLEGLKEQIAELLQLQPHRDDMHRLLAQLPKEPPKPVRPSLLLSPFDGKQAKSAQEAWAKQLGIGAEITNRLGMQFRVIPPGTFEMGSPKAEPERSPDEPLHTVTITQPKLFGVYPVTQGEWTKLMGSNPSHFKTVAGQDTSRFPVEQVSWDDCQEFLKKLNAQYAMKGWRYRLPTEAEWEYACRAGTVTPFWFGGELNGQQANCDGNYPYESGKGPYVKRPCVVGSYKANPYGLYDQHGQVWEWCEDWYGEYDRSASQDPAGPSSGSSRVLRGGSWYDSASGCRSAFRRSFVPSFRFFSIGFRVLCELS